MAVIHRHHGRTAVAITDLCNANAGRSRGVSGREISKNGLRFLAAIEKKGMSQAESFRD